MVKFEVEKYISESVAIDYVIDLALFSNHTPLDMIPMNTISRVADYLKKAGTTIPSYAKEISFFEKDPTHFYNLSGPTWDGDATISHIDPKTGKERTIISDEGIAHLPTYWAKFDQAQSSFENAIEEANYELLLSAFSKLLSYQ